jgi:outer membrane biosynthesis protein TonB
MDQIKDREVLSMNRLLVALVVVCLLASSVAPLAIAQGPGDDQPTVEAAAADTATDTPVPPTDTPTAEPTATEVAEPTATEVVEPTATEVVEPTATEVVEPTAAVTPTVEPTATEVVEPTATEVVEPTATEVVEPTATEVVEPTATETVVVEPTATETPVPSETPTVEPTATLTPTVEPTATLTPTEVVTPTTEGGINAQAYSGAWSSTVAVQNMGSADADINIAWYKNGASSTCYNTVDTTPLAAGASRSYAAPSSGCGSSWVGSAVVSSNQPVAAVAENLGSLGQLLSDYLGGTAPSTEDIILPQTDNYPWDPLVGISNAGSDVAHVVLTFLNNDGTVFTTTTRTIYPQSGTQIHVRTDVTSTRWKGSIRISQTGTAQPLYAVIKSERVISGKPYPVSIAYEGWKVSDAKNNFAIPQVLKRMSGSLPNGQNGTIAVGNPSTTTSVNFTIKWFDGTGAEVVAARQVVSNFAPSASRFFTTRDIATLPNNFNGTAQVEATGPVIVLSMPWFAKGSVTGYTSWAVFNPVDPTTATDTVYIPSIHKQSSGGARTGTGWCTSILAANLSATQVTTINVKMYNSTTGAMAYDEDVAVAPNGKVTWYTLLSGFDADLGSNFFGGAMLTVAGGPGPIIAVAAQTGKAYPNSDSYGFYNGVNQ